MESARRAAAGAAAAERGYARQRKPPQPSPRQGEPPEARSCSGSAPCHRTAPANPGEPPVRGRAGGQCLLPATAQPTATEPNIAAQARAPCRPAVRQRLGRGRRIAATAHFVVPAPGQSARPPASRDPRSTPARHEPRPRPGARQCAPAAGYRYARPAIDYAALARAICPTPRQTPRHLPNSPRRAHADRDAHHHPSNARPRVAHRLIPPLRSRRLSLSVPRALAVCICHP